MRCFSCGAANADDADTCASCGLPVEEFAPGELIAGRYEIVSRLGRGGMGVVYEARDRSLDETIALKIIRPGFGSPELLARFRNEIRLARRVRHRNVCSIFGDGDHAGRLFLSMERIDGVDLKRKLRTEGALGAAEGFDAAIQAADGLAAVHATGVLHRDLKTANLMRDRDGRVVVMDFGLARPAREMSTGLTEAGRVVGTPEYMSPEQAKDAALTPASDVYSLALIVYELFTGERPFRGDTPVGTLVRRLSEPPPLDRAVSLGLPQALVPVLRKALAIRPEERHVDGAAFASALRAAKARPADTPDALSSAATLSTVAQTPVRTRRGVALGLLLTLVAGFLLLKATPTSDPLPSPRPSPPAAVAPPPQFSADLKGDQVDCLITGRFTALRVRLPDGQKPTGRLYFKSNLSSEYFFTAIVARGGEFLGYIPKINPGGGIREITYHFSVSKAGDAPVAEKTAPHVARVVDREAECRPRDRLAEAGDPGALSVMSTVGEDLALPIADAFGFQSLLGGLRDPDPEVRLATVRSLSEMATLVIKVIDDAVSSLQSSKPARREGAANDLAVTGKQAVRGTVDALVASLRDAKPELRRSVATTLGRLGRALSGARAALSARLRDPDRDVRIAATGALAAMGAVVNTITSSLSDAEDREDDDQTEEALSQALRAIGGSLAPTPAPGRDPPRL